MSPAKWVLNMIKDKVAFLTKKGALPKWFPKGTWNWKPTEEQAKKLLDLLNNKKVSATEASEILDALYQTDYMPSESGGGAHEMYLQSKGYLLTREEAEAMDEFEVGSLLHNIFYGGKNLVPFTRGAIDILVNKVIGLVPGEDDAAVEANEAPPGYEVYRKSLELGIPIKEETKEIVMMISNNDLDGLVKHLEKTEDPDIKNAIQEYLLDNVEPK